MELFPRKPRTILDELTLLEKMMPSYKAEMLKVSKFIRNKVWGRVNDEVLFGVLSTCNMVISLKIQIIGEEFEIISEYICVFSNAICKYTQLDISFESFLLLKEMWENQLTRVVLKQWTQLDPERWPEFEENELYAKSLLQIMDDFWDSLTPESECAFIRPLKAYSKLIRGRKRHWTKAAELAAPSLEDIEKYHILNRWTPPGKRYLYLVDADSPSRYPEKTCMEEMRITDATLDVTIANFTVCARAFEEKILDLDYEDISVDDIFIQRELSRMTESGKIICELRTSGFRSESRIRKQIKIHEEETKNIATIFCGRMLFKQICSAIFVPLDDEEDNDYTTKERCYKSFHLFSEWCESKGISGIRYPSTRMKLINEKGSNLVLFDADAAVADESSFRICRNEDGWKEVNLRE